MANVNEKMTAIADAIRDKTGKTGLLNLDDMASGVDEVYETGKKARNDEWWGAYLSDTRENISQVRQAYRFAGSGWNDDTFYPTQDIYVRYGYGMFYYSRVSNIKKRLEDCGVKFIFDGALDAGMMFESSSTTELPVIELNKLSNPEQCQRLCYCCYSLATIEKIVAVEGNRWGNSFAGCSKLANVIFEGVIGQTISFSSSPLTVESMKSVITHLKDYSGTESAGAYTITLKDSCKILMAEQGAIEELGGKTYDAYIADIGWNLA